MGKDHVESIPPVGGKHGEVFLPVLFGVVPVFLAVLAVKEDGHASDRDQRFFGNLPGGFKPILPLGREINLLG